MTQAFVAVARAVFLAAGVALWFAAGVSSGQAMEATVVDVQGSCLINLAGAVGPNDPLQFETVAKQSPQCRVVNLDIRAGTLGPALTIGRSIRRLGLSTLVTGQSACAGVCVWMLGAGVNRAVNPKGAVGLQFMSVANNKAIEQVVHDQIQRFGTAAAAPIIRAVEQSSAQMMSGVMIYMAEMGLSPALMDALANASPTAPRWLSRQELADWRIVTVSG